MKPKPPSVPPPRRETLRRRIMDLLYQGACSAREISGGVGLPEKEVSGHLEHIRRSLQTGPREFVLIPSACKNCGFVFRQREKLTRPSRCPQCRSEAIQEPLFLIRDR